MLLYNQYEIKNIPTNIYFFFNFTGDVTIPPSTTVAILAFMAHRNPDIYPDPESFRPERYLSGETFHPFAHIAFSAGPRNCIGQKFAMLELKCTLSSLLRAFVIHPVEDFEPQLMAQLILNSRNGIQVRLAQRNTSGSN